MIQYSDVLLSYWAGQRIADVNEYLDLLINSSSKFIYGENQCDFYFDHQVALYNKLKDKDLSIIKDFKLEYTDNCFVHNYSFDNNDLINERERSFFTMVLIKHFRIELSKMELNIND